MRREASGVAGEGQTGARDLRVLQRRVEPEVAGERLELQRIAPAGEEVAQAQHQAGGTSVGRDCRVRSTSFSAARVTCFRILASAASSALRWSCA